MTHVVVSGCVDCKYQECVAVCPVDAFREAETYLVIDPDECIDCAACVPECPIEAIEPDTNKNANKWIDMNKKYSEMWPNITKKRISDVPTDQNKWRDVKDKLKYFSEKPGKGD